MAKLFLDGIFTGSSESPSSIKIEHRNSDGVKDVSLVGLTTSDPSFSAQNKWGPIINDVGNLQDLASLMGSSNYLSWIGASVMCWKGTTPLSLGVDFYLINYKRGLRLEENLEAFVKLAALDVTSENQVKIHGGYIPDVLANNQDQKYWNGSISSVSDLNNMGLEAGATNNITKGVITITFGHKSTISQLLLSKVDVTESNIEVADENGGNRKPLYYKVSAQFTGVRPLLTTDVESMFSF